MTIWDSCDPSGTGTKSAHYDGSLFFHIDYREVHYCKVLVRQHLWP